jgi:hypothetical protein
LSLLEPEGSKVVPKFILVQTWPLLIQLKPFLGVLLFCSCHKGLQRHIEIHHFFPSSKLNLVQLHRLYDALLLQLKWDSKAHSHFEAIKQALACIHSLYGQLRASRGY